MQSNFLYHVGHLLQQSEPDNLINGSFPQVIGSIKIAPDEPDLKRGSLLGCVAEGPNKGKYRLANAEAKDGSAQPVCILADDHKSASNNLCPVYLSGQFNLHSLHLGQGLKLEELAFELRKLSIFISPSIARIRP